MNAAEYSVGMAVEVRGGVQFDWKKGNVAAQENGAWRVAVAGFSHNFIWHPLSSCKFHPHR